MPLPDLGRGTVHGENIRKSLDLRDWEAASRLVREWEVYRPESTITVQDACDRFVSDAKARLRPSSVLKYEQSVKMLKETLGAKTVRQVSVDDVRLLRENWKVSPLTMQKRLET